VAGRPRAAGRAGGEANREQSYAHSGGVEEVVAARGKHGERMSGGTHDHQSGHKREVEHEDGEQALCSGHD
jgi:hypothetical protein